MKGQLKNDKYKKARGGPSRLLRICCAACDAEVVQYQKDGIGHLKRLYLDRIMYPAGFAHLALVSTVSSVPKLVCEKCSALIGTPYVYAREARLAFLLVPGSFAKRSI